MITKLLELYPYDFCGEINAAHSRKVVVVASPNEKVFKQVLNIYTIGDILEERLIGVGLFSRGVFLVQAYQHVLLNKLVQCGSVESCVYIIVVTFQSRLLKNVL